MRKLMGLWVLFVVGFVSKCVDGFEYFNLTELRFESFYGVSASDGNNPLTVGLTLIQGAAAKGAGTLSLSLSLYIYIYICFLFPKMIFFFFFLLLDLYVYCIQLFISLLFFFIF
ncbi:hypothetical protein CsSME_00025242 [Camellia sinensis var. sinensis]